MVVAVHGCSQEPAWGHVVLDFEGRLTRFLRATAPRFTGHDLAAHALSRGASPRSQQPPGPTAVGPGAAIQEGGELCLRAE